MLQKYHVDQNVYAMDRARLVDYSNSGRRHHVVDYRAPYKKQLKLISFSESVWQVGQHYDRAFRRSVHTRYYRRRREGQIQNAEELDNSTNSIHISGYSKSKESTTSFEKALGFYADRSPNSMECRSATVFDFYPSRDFKGQTFH